MNLNTITRVMVFSALTLASHLALADGVLNPGNPDSVDFAASITTDKNTCKLTVAPSSNNFSFTYTYSAADVTNGTNGDVTPTSGQKATVLVAVPQGCRINSIRTHYVPNGLTRMSQMVAGAPTRNGGLWPLDFALDNVQFYTTSDGTGQPAYATTAPEGYTSVYASTDTMQTPVLGYLVFNNANGANAYGTDNGGVVKAISTVTAGYMTTNGNSRAACETTTVNNSRMNYCVTGGLARLGSGYQQPQNPGNFDGSRTFYPTTVPGSTSSDDVDTVSDYSSVVFTVVPLIGLYPYGSATKLPDPETALDSSGGVAPITGSSTLTFTVG